MLKRVKLDPGHGGSDSGGVANGLKEKDLNLTVALKTRDYLLANYEADVSLTREKDISLAPDERVKRVADYNPHLCVSIHHNMFNKLARGAEVIHAHYDEYDDVLALDILARLAKAGMPTRRAFTKLNDKNADWYYMIRRIWDHDTDAIICEGGFVDNAQDAALLKSIKYLNAEAEAYAISTAEYLQLPPKAVTAEQQLYIGISRLQNVGIINSPRYWIDNAKEGKLVKGEFAQALIIKTGEYIRNRG
jgi:N-acetylmuramoyl-L-alanine amidase